MTIALSANTPRVSYTVAQGATQTAFTVNFEFFDEADLNFYVDGTLKTISTHYTVSGGDGATGTINTTVGNSVVGITGGSTVVITRSIEFARTTDFPSSGAFEVATLNTELDRFTAIAADISDETSRSMQLADQDTAVSMTLPLKADRVGTVLGFNATTGAVEAGPTITAVQSLSAVTASINLLGTSDAVSDMNLLATSANITAMGHLGTSANVTAMGHIGTSANVTAMGLLGTATVVADMAALATTDVIADMAALAESDVLADMAQLATDDFVADLNQLAQTDFVNDLNQLAQTDFVNDLNQLATTDFVNDLNSIATTTVIANIATVADNISTIGQKATLDEATALAIALG